jgi:hypothetical protein
MARPRAGSPGVAVSGCGMPSPTPASAKPAPAARARAGQQQARPWAAIRPAQVLVLQRQLADALAGGGEDGVQHRRRRHRDGGLAHAAPEAARGHHDGLDLGHAVHRITG